MDQSEQSSGGRPPPRRELQGPRPAPLKVRKDSHKIRKPPVAPVAQAQQQPPPQQPPRKPVIIYAVSPKVIHTNPSDFMTLVQRLTGQDSATTSCPPSSDISTSTATSSSSFSGPAVLSPAARFAAIEKTKVPQEGKIGYSSSVVEGVDTIGLDLLDSRGGGNFSHSILSPGPAGLLRPVPPTFFSPLSDPSPLVSLYHQHQHHQDQFNAIQQLQQSGGGGSGSNKSYMEVGVGGGSTILPSPSAAAFLSPNPMLSPTTIEFLSRLLD